MKRKLQKKNRKKKDENRKRRKTLKRNIILTCVCMCVCVFRDVLGANKEQHAITKTMARVQGHRKVNSETFCSVL